MPEWITVKEASKIRKCTPANMRYLITQGIVQGRKEGGKWLVNKESLNEEKEITPVHYSETSWRELRIPMLENPGPSLGLLSLAVWHYRAGAFGLAADDLHSATGNLRNRKALTVPKTQFQDDHGKQGR